jgi:hypothetical protein
MAPGFDPQQLLELAFRAAQTGARIVGWSEHQLTEALRAVLADPETEPAESTDGSVALDVRMQRLLDHTSDDAGGSSRQVLFHKILDQLVPDEARIIESLASVAGAPLVDVYSSTARGEVPVLENMSSVARTASLSLPQLTPTYVSHLLALGLVEAGAEDPAYEEDYHLLAADTLVQRAVKQASRARAKARVEQRTLRLSALGRELWTASAPRSVS